MSYFAVARLNQVDAQGLFDCLQSSLRRLGIQALDSEQCKLLVGIGTDGATAIVAAGGLKGLIEKQIPWLHWSWCQAHRVELAVKDALKGTAFDLFNDMPLHLYYTRIKNIRK